ncbi:MAG: FAD binding domain-containing protein [Nitrososphaerales archaeon]
MVFDPSEVLRPSSIQDAVEALELPDSRIVAGNTTLYSLSRKGNLDQVKSLIDISRLDLSYVREEQQRQDSGETSEKKNILVGAGTTFKELTSSPLLIGHPEYAGLIEALQLSPPQIRNVATIGGSICSAVSFYDVPVMLMALGANLKFFSKKEGEHFVSIDSFFQNLSRNEKSLLVECQLQVTPNSASSFVKLCRRMSGYAVVMVAAKVKLDRSGKKIDDIHVAIGAMTKTPQRLYQLEESFRHIEPSITTITKLCETDASLIGEILPSVHASREYKKQVLPALLKQSITSAVERAREK